MSNTPQHPQHPQHPPATDAPPGAPMQPHAPPGSFSPAPHYPQPAFTPAGHPQQPVFTPAGGTQQGFHPAQHVPQAAAPQQPVPPASPPPPGPPPVYRPITPSRNPIVRLILWFTEPSMLKGMAMGVILALIVGVAIRLEAMWYIISGLLLILFVCLFGVIIGHYLFEHRRKKLQARGLEMLREAGGELPALSDNVITMLWSRDRSQLPAVWDRIRRIKPAVEELGGLTIAVVFRTMAMSALFAVLGAAISFAVFLTSFMQVERMTEQNKLIQRQIKQTDDQMRFESNAAAVAVALSIAESRQATLRDLISDIDLKGNKDAPLCGAEVPPNRLGERKRCLPEDTARELSTFIPLLQPYKPVLPGADGAENRVADTARSPEQQQFLRYLSGNNIEVGSEALDLSTAFLDHADLHGIALERIRLAGVKMRQAQLHDSDLTGAVLTGVDLTLGVASRAKLTQAFLTDAVVRRANLSGADLTGANLIRADLFGANMKGAVLQQAQLGGAILHGANLVDANLTGADLGDADLTLANFDRATLPQVPRVREAAFWWLGVYKDDYAGKLGLGPEAQQRNQAALDRWSTARTDEEAAAIVAELKAAAPTAPG
ncbi:MAG: pentapeptide repeat-containing protein [Myxococcales bacterium]|nr:pentapeptide repeat-containing protein [Myxococcales bacterium]